MKKEIIKQSTQERVFLALKRHFNGVDNGEDAHTVANLFCMSDRDFRRVCRAINSNSQINGIISTSGKIYACATEDECRKAIQTTYRMAFAYLLKARAMEKKVGLQNQVEFDNNGTKVKIVYED